MDKDIKEEIKQIKRMLDMYILHEVINKIFSKLEDNFDELDINTQIKITALITRGYSNHDTAKA